MPVVTKDAVRSVNWGKSYKWEVEIDPKPNSPFDKFFPAISVTENLLALDTFSIDGSISNFEVPKGTSLFTIDIQFLDDINHTLADYFSEWVNQRMLNGGTAISALRSCIRQMTVRKLLNDNSLAKTTTYEVYPKGDLNFVGNSDSGVPEYSLQFIVAGSV